MRVLLYKSVSGKSPIEKFIRGLSKPDQAKFADVKKGIEEHGLEFERVEFKQLEGKLWEIKFKGQDGSYRIAYVIAEQGLMVWLHAFKKDSQKTNREDLELAKRRMKEVMS